MQTPPIIVIGMHRSGTTMVTQMLERLGVFVGWRKDQNCEPHFLQRLNDWLLHQAGGAWDHPLPVRDLLANAPARSLAADYLRLQMRAPASVSFWGVSRRFRGREQGHWGWKDPRNTFTLPLWLDLYPDARIVDVSRHGVDVADSLVRRQAKSIERRTAKYKKRRPLYLFRPRRGGFAESYRCGTMHGAFSLWREYVDEASRCLREYEGRVLHIQYEIFLERPREELERVSEFLRLGTSSSAIASAARHVRPERAFAYRKRPELLEFAQTVASDLERSGYAA